MYLGSTRVARWRNVSSLIVVGVACMHAQTMNADRWLAGVASIDITPTEPVWMSGYASRTRTAEGVGQRLWAKALALEDSEGRRAILLTADLCGITGEITERVIQALEHHRVSRSSVLLNVSHTHSAPIVEGHLLLREFTSQESQAIAKYRVRLERELVTVAEAAFANMRAASLYSGYDSADFGVNRRNNREKEVLAPRNEGQLKGPVDHDVPLLVIRGADASLVAFVTLYACHNTTLNGYSWSGDYAGYAQEEIERRYPGSIALFTQGCGGDINPLPRRDIALARKYGAQLADAVDRILGRDMAKIEPYFGSAFQEIALALASRPDPAELRAAEASASPVARAWAAKMRHYQETGVKRYPVQAWRLGHLSWVALGGEVVVDYALRLKREIGRDLWVLGYSNDVMAYIPSERILVEGGYEGRSSMMVYGLPGPWAPGLEQAIVSAAHWAVTNSRMP